MIESFEKIKISKPALSCCELTLLPTDTLVVRFDQDIWDLDEANQIFQHIAQLYPKTKMMAIYKGIELGVIHNVD